MRKSGGRWRNGTEERGAEWGQRVGQGSEEDEVEEQKHTTDDGAMGPAEGDRDGPAYAVLGRTLRRWGAPAGKGLRLAARPAGAPRGPPE